MGSDNIYALLGDLLSMYAVNRSSITACWTGDLNKHLLTDSNKMINYAEIHVYWVDVECDICSAKTLLFWVITVMNVSDGQWKLSINRNRELNFRVLQCHCEAQCHLASGMLLLPTPGSKAQILPSVSLFLSSQHLMSTFSGSAAEEAAAFWILKLGAVLCVKQ